MSVLDMVCTDEFYRLAAKAVAKMKKMRAMLMLGKVWFFHDGTWGRRADGQKLSGSVFFRDDPPTLEIYGHGFDTGQCDRTQHGQIFPSRAQLVALDELLHAYLKETEGELK